MADHIRTLAYRTGNCSTLSGPVDSHATSEKTMEYTTINVSHRAALVVVWLSASRGAFAG